MLHCSAFLCSLHFVYDVIYEPLVGLDWIGPAPRTARAHTCCTQKIFSDAVDTATRTAALIVQCTLITECVLLLHRGPRVPPSLSPSLPRLLCVTSAVRPKSVKNPEN